MLQLAGVTRQDRFRVTAQLTDALSGAGGWILDHQLYSNLALCIQFEIESAHLPRLAEALVGTELSFSAESQEVLRGLRASSGGAGRVHGTLRAAFVHDEPDLKIPLPLG